MLAFLLLTGLAVVLSQDTKEYPSVDQHVVNGTPTRANQYPWQAGLKRGRSHTCGASLISATWVMTAAHCVRSGGSFNVVLGQHNRLAGEGVTISVAQVTSHPSYSHTPSQGFPNDIALLRLSRAAPIDGTKIRAAKLPPSSSTSYVGVECYISGWGRYSTGSNSLARTLLHARINVLSLADCQRRVSTPLRGYHICVKDAANRQGTCNGDSGGPINCNRSGYEVAGIASFVYGNCSTTMPSVYAHVAFFRDWIRRISGV